MKILVTLFIFLNILNAEGCWSALELSQIETKMFDEDNTIISLKDANDCKPIANASIVFLNKKFISDKNGYLTLPNPPQEIDTAVEIEIKKDGYITQKERVDVAFGSFWQKNFLLSKKLPPESLRVVLSWGAKPKDLDLHLLSPDFHISFRHKKSIANLVKLDRDARNGYGPETITLDKIKADGKYKIVVHKYSRNGSFNSKARVAIYMDNTLVSSVPLISTKASCLEVGYIKNQELSIDVKEIDDRYCLKR